MSIPDGGLSTGTQLGGAGCVSSPKLFTTNSTKFHEQRGVTFGEGAFSEATIQSHYVNYKNVLIRCHKKKVRLLICKPQCCLRGFVLICVV